MLRKACIGLLNSVLIMLWFQEVCRVYANGSNIV
jgi:hypothetical protein